MSRRSFRNPRDFFCLLLVLICSAHANNIYPASTLYINSNEGLLFHLILPPSFAILECRLIYDGVEIFRLIPGTSEPQVTNNYETIETLGGDRCGARVHNVSSLSPASWQLQADSQDESTAMVSGTLRLSIISSVAEARISSVTGAAGHFGTIHCPGDPNHQRHCEISNPHREITDGCDVQVKYPPVASQPLVYLCRVFFWGRVDAVNSEIHVYSYASAARVIPNQAETTDHVLFSCAINESLTVCRAERLTTNGNQFLVMDGFQSRRYSTWNTQLEGGLCQFEIPKPVAANETGVWRIHGKLKASGLWTGCLFHLETDLNQEYEIFREGLVNSVVVNLTTTKDMIEIRCVDAPYTLDYCYLVTPKQIIRPAVREMDLFKAYGRCTFTRVEAVTGRYSCGFNSLDHSGDLWQHFDVRYNAPSVFAAAEADVVVVNNQSRHLTVKCFALQGYSINSCTFVAPSGDLYHLTNSSYANSGFAYVGGGFEDGECGIQLSHVEKNIGNWTCSVGLVDRIGLYDVYILVKREEEGDGWLRKWSYHSLNYP